MLQAFPLPKKLTIEPRKEPNSADIFIEPLYPGYGTTIGNALRRVLLSSLEGAAVTSVVMQGVNHEFSTLPAIKEDVVSILLNLKLLRFTLEGDEPATMTLKVKGERNVTGADFAGPSGTINVTNRDQHIATLTNPGATLDMEIMVEKGLGYLPVENREKEKLAIGRIAVDAIFTPIRNVNFEVEHVRVGQRTDFDKLVLRITTDGSVTPEGAMRKATMILADHFAFLLAPKETAGAPDETPESVAETEEEKPKKRPRKTAES